MNALESETKGVSFSIETASYAGLGFYWAWLFLVFYSPALMPSADYPGSSVRDIWMWSAWAHAITLLVVAFLARRIDTLIRRRPVAVSVAFIVCFGTALIPLAGTLFGDYSFVADGVRITGAVITGAGTALLVLMWGEAYSKMGAWFSLAGVIASYAVSAVFYFALQVLSPAIAIGSIILLPALSLLCLMVAERHGAVSAVPVCKRASKRFSPRVLMPLVAIFLYALCGEILRGFATVSGEKSSLDAMGMLYVGGSVAGVIVLGILARVAPALRKSNPGELPGIRTALLIMAAGFLVTALFDVSFFVAYAIFGAAFMVCRALVWMYSTYIIEKLDISPLAVFGVSQGCFALAVVVGTPVVQMFASMAPIGGAQWTTIALVAIFLIFATAVSILNHKDISTIWGLAEPAITAGNRSCDTPAVIDPIVVLKERYALSDREAEVATLLAKGRSLPFIQKELHIAKGTAQTHLNHIYRKLNVHSRQEFLDLVEAEKTAKPAE